MKGFPSHSAIHSYYHNKFTLTTTEDRRSQCLDKIFLSNSNLPSGINNTHSFNKRKKNLLLIIICRLFLFNYYYVKGVYIMDQSNYGSSVSDQFHDYLLLLQFQIVSTTTGVIEIKKQILVILCRTLIVLLSKRFKYFVFKSFDLERQQQQNHSFVKT